MADYGLALAGGGTRGAAHVGVLTALEEEGLLPDRIAGTSAGSIVAGLYASGMKMSKMQETVQWLARHGKRYIDPDISGILLLLPQILLRRKIALRGIIKGDRLLRYLCDLTSQAQIQKDCKKLLIPAVDINTGNTVVFTNIFQGRIPVSAMIQKHVQWERTGSLAEIMMASSSAPAVFCPRKIKDYLLVDGGATNNLPVNLLIAAGGPKVIGIDVGIDYQKPYDDSIIETSFHAFSIMGRELKNCGSSGEVLLLKPKLEEKAGLLTFEYMEKCMEDGYVYTKKMIPQIRRVLQ